jgi:peroxiredoxin
MRPLDDGSQSEHALPPEPPSAEVEAGDRAPDFSFQGDDDRWHRLHDLLHQGPVLLVFGAEPEILKQVEHERDAILRLGAIPVAVLDVRNGVAWAMARRFGLEYPVVPDSRRVIAAQFNTLDPTGERTAPAWFVVDRSGRVRAVERRDLPRAGYTTRVAMALGLPDPGASVSIDKRR